MDKSPNSNKVNEKCQVFTPPHMAQDLLDIAQYNIDNNLLGKKVLESSFGNGSVLEEIVKRYIASAKQSGYSNIEISQGLGNDIFGVEIDENLFHETVEKLDAIVLANKIPHVPWKFYNGDFLSLSWDGGFDYIIGNPPYVSYRELDPVTRTDLRTRFESCKRGKFDYCYAFIEKSVGVLNSSGKLVQIVPNNIYKNVHGFCLREILKSHISMIETFPNQRIFGPILASASIFVYDLAENSEHFLYSNATDSVKVVLDRKILSNEKWLFTNKKAEGNHVFGNYFKASNAVATLLNEAFIVRIDEAKSINEDLLWKAASPKSIRGGKEEWILFPYIFDDKKQLIHLTEKQLKNKFPQSYKHLKKYRKSLNERKSEKAAQWFEFGRSQALTHIYQEKLLLSTVVTNHVELYQLDDRTIPYTGIFIIPISSEYTLQDAMKILQSKKFLDYVKVVGTHVNGGSIRITSKDINNYKW